MAVRYNFSQIQFQSEKTVPNSEFFIGVKEFMFVRPISAALSESGIAPRVWNSSQRPA